VVTATAQATARAARFSNQASVECVLELRPADFYKTMEATRAPGLWQDVYHPCFGGVDLYVKLRVKGGALAVVISLKER
jgi:hypothetical protein